MDESWRPWAFVLWCAVLVLAYLGLRRLRTGGGAGNGDGVGDGDGDGD